MIFEVLTAIVGMVGGAIASVTGFGVGSCLTPWVAVRTGIKLAVAAMAIPHLSGTALRLWQLRKEIDYRVVATFGLTNAAGGLVGALLHSSVQSPVIGIVFGGLLAFAGLAGLTGFSERMRFGPRTAYVAGFLSGGLGGFSGTQGGLRAAALFGFDLSKQSFVATATAIAILVDGARTPIYLWSAWDELNGVWPLIAVATAGVLLGTVLGQRLLRRIPERRFRTIVSGLILVLGVFTIVLNGPFGR